MKTKIILCFLVFSSMLGSCKKFLEEPVDNRTLITTISDMEKTLNYLLPYSDYHFTDLMTDDYIFRDLSGHIVASAADQTLPIFELAITRESISSNQLLSSGFNPVTAFRRYYYRIINSWLLIEKAESYNPRDDKEKRRIELIIAKAKAIKGYCNYMLTSLFAKQYNPATAATDKAVPYIDKYYGEAVVPFNRISIQEMYGHIEKDLKDALAMVNDTEETATPFTFSKDAILGILSRFYLDKQDYDNCIDYSNQLLARRDVPLNVKQLRTSIRDYAQYSDKYFDPSNAAYLLMGNNTYQLIAYFFHGMYPYPALQFMTDWGADSANNYVIQTSALFRDYVPQKFGKFFNTSARNFNMPLMTVDEVYFNRAEAMIKKYNGLNDQAKADLLLLSRNSNFMKVVVDYFTSIIDELEGVDEAMELLLLIKRIRFSSEGMRWFDMKRNNLPVTHVGRSGTYTIDGTDPEAYVIKLPQEEITRNIGAE